MGTWFSLTQGERVALTFIAHNDPKDGFVRRTWLEFKAAICGLLQRTRSGGWIPVSERLPVDIPHGYCLVTDGTNVGTANYSKESNVFDHCIDRDYWKPSHWMPLPEPPEVK